MKRLLSENTSKEKKTDITYEQLNAIDNHYFQKTGIYETIIDKQYKYTSVEALLLEIGNSIENRESELNIDKKDFIRIFKDVNLIYRKVVNLSLYHYSEFKNLKRMILILYTQRNRSIFKIIEQSNFFIDSLGEEVEILIDIRTVENKIQEKVEIFYNHKKI